MPIVADTLSAAARARLGVIAEPAPVVAAPPPTRREREQKRDALVEVSGHLDWQGRRCLACPRCSRVFLASSLRRLHTPGADDSLVCRKCADQAIAALGHHSTTNNRPR